ncbi:MAG: rod-binding protein [Armatimonadetes bacterium]|nr:rod-binding protein [Armatimonadota bacterium]
MIPPTNNRGAAPVFSPALEFNLPPGATPREALRAATREFESLFVAHLLREMRRTVPQGGLIPQGAGEEIFRDMLDQALARQAAERSLLGLADLLYDQFARQLPDQGTPAVSGNARELRDAHRE